MNTWLDRAVFYEIYPQSFNDTNDDGIGDIPGIIEKLDYIKELGCNALWLNPCFVSPFGDAGYDVADYCQVAPRYGTNDDLVRLFDECHKRGMHVLLDLVPGHTSIEHPWFKESCRADENECTGRYVWNDNVWAPMDVKGINGVLRGISERNGAVGHEGRHGVLARARLRRLPCRYGRLARQERPRSGGDDRPVAGYACLS